jgi:hypothetical protein
VWRSGVAAASVGTGRRDMSEEGGHFVILFSDARQRDDGEIGLHQPAQRPRIIFDDMFPAR